MGMRSIEMEAAGGASRSARQSMDVGDPTADPETLTLIRGLHFQIELGPGWRILG